MQQCAKIRKWLRHEELFSVSTGMIVGFLPVAQLDRATAF